MIDATTVPDHHIRFTTRMIRDLAVKRGWKVWMYYVGSAQLRLQRPDGKILEVFSATPPTTTYAAGSRANDKYFTHLVLQEAGLDMPETYLVRDLDEAKEHVNKFIADGKEFVIKPLDSGHGKGVSVELKTLEDAERAFTYAKEFSNGVIVQECLTHPIDVRIACINYKFVAALVRIPARVKGDGEHTIDQLIDITNQDERRGENYSKALNVINKEQAAHYVGGKMHDVPAKDEYVQVLGTANVGTGGETTDITDDTPQWLRDLAEKASTISALPSAGVDFLLNRMPKADDTPESLQAKIIELNKCPALFLHETPTYGTPRPATDTYLDYLETL